MAPSHISLMGDICPDLDCIPVINTSTKRRDFLEAFEFVLQHQLVIDKRTGTTYAVTAGSGMGTLVSCDACDTCLYHRAEQPWATRSDIMADHGIKLYVRYRDDIFIVATSGPLVWQYIRGFRERLRGAWTCNIEQVSKSEVQMLDLTVSKSRFTLDTLQWRPFFKPSSRTVPLSMSSCHHNMVHSWATNGLVRLSRNSCCSFDFEVAKAKYLTNLFAAHLEHSRIISTMAFNPFQQRALASVVARNFSVCHRPERTPIQITLVLDYHPFWNLGGLQHALSQLCERHNDFCMFFWGSHLSIRVAWRNAGPTLALTLRSL